MVGSQFGFLYKYYSDILILIDTIKFRLDEHLNKYISTVDSIEYIQVSFTLT